MRFIFLFIVLSMQSLPGISQYSINGKIESESREPITGATVQLQSKQKTYSASSNEQGDFLFADIQNGRYSLKVSSIGYEEFVETIIVDGRSAANNLKIRLIQTNALLQSVEVTGRTSRKYTSDYSFGATKTATLNKDIPLGISTITKELIEDRQAFQLADAVKIASGVIPSSYYNQYAIRGISQNEEGQIINGMRTRQYYFLQPLTTNIERVEVIKGPASASFSSVDPGGSINLVTKKPLNVSRKNISVSAGSFSTIRGTLDFTGPLNDSKTLLYRLNAAYQEAKSFRDLVGQKNLLLSPSFSYIPSKKTAINVELIYSNNDGKLDRGQPIFGAIAGQTKLNSTPIELNLGAPNDYFKSKELLVMGNLSHEFTKGISVVGSYMKQTWNEDLLEHRTTNAFAVDLQNQPVTSLAAMQMVQRQQNWNIDNINSYLKFDFSTGTIRHILLAGYDLHSWQKLKGGGQNAARGFYLKDGTISNSFNPANADNYQTIVVRGTTLPSPNVPHFDLQNPAYTIRNISDYQFSRTSLPAALTTTNSVFIQEQLQWRKFTLLASLRNEWFRDLTNYKSSNEIDVRQSRLLPRIGLTYSVLPNLNLYATYLQGFQPQANTVTLLPVAAPSGSSFAPLENDLKEIGLKSTLLKGRFFLNTAIYEINQRNILMNANDPVNPDLLVTRGAERSRGFEMDAAGYLLPNWQINLSYSYIDAIIVNDSDESLKGARKQNTPYNSGNLWTRYNFARGSFLKDLGVGLGLQYNGDRIPWFNRSFKVPAYTLLDMAVYYTLSGSNMQLSLQVNNLLDETYWIGAQNYLRLFPGAPRNLLFHVSYSF
ncbi:TonB-dependent siderophore receptor [Flavihumibacter cheonanensis]|uniref:TonB-dependent receptor n=1 Tax=Flavihumibacter cheonanensis TaxID=1442385 RepID=UPI001EF7F6A3|nr:TonB-dependent receptor [Flavihumibacter cheonanensis]MCG7753337.1 TonB-dependent receptor [Flavihumibacter cheonanensis]